MLINKDVLKELEPESVVRSHLIQNGFTVSRRDKSQNANGIDIVAIKNDKHFLIEVKKVNSNKKYNKIEPIQKSGKICSHIAIVTPNNNVIFQPMRDHLSLCSKNGSRGVTDLIRIYDI